MFTLVFRNQALLLMTWTLFAESLLYGRDGKTYKTVNIGSQWWMAENLNYETEKGSWCVEGDADGFQYGRFYDWETAKMVPSPGWHLPSKQEFQYLLALVTAGKNAIRN